MNNTYHFNLYIKVNCR